MLKRLSVVGTGVLVSVACFALSRPGASADPPAPQPYWRLFDPLALWQRTTRSAPLASSVMVEIVDALSAQCANGSSLTPAGCVTAEEVPTEDGPSTPPTPPVRRLLPVHHFSPERAGELTRRQAMMGLFLGSIKHLSSAQLDGLADPLPFTYAAQVESVALGMVEFLAAEDKQSKCEAYRSVQSHARALGWQTPAPGQEVVGPAGVAPGWGDLTSRVVDVYRNKFLTSVPPQLCELRPVTDRASVFARVHDTAERTIKERTRVEVERTLLSYTAARQRYASLLTRSQIPVSTDILLDLRRSVSDSSALFSFVASDPEGFWNARNGQASLLSQLTTALSRVRGANTANLETPEEVAARETLTLYRGALDRVATKLRGVAAMPELSDASKAKLVSCTTVTSPGSGDVVVGAPLDAAGIAAMQTCMLAVTDLYRELKSNSMPENEEFGAKVQHLSSAFLRVLQ